MLKLISIILLFSQLCFTQIIVNPRRAAVINPPVSGVTPFYTIDFEEGDLSEWTHTGANASAHADAAYSGSYGMRSQTSTDMSYYTFASAKDSVYVTFYIKIPDATTFSSGAYSFQSWFYDGSWSTERTVFGGQVTDIGGGVYKQTSWGEGITGGAFGSDATNFDRTNWHKIKMYFKRGATSLHRIWVDDDMIFDGTAAYDINIEGFSHGIYQPTVSSGYYYYDDIKFYTEDPD